MEKKKFFKYEVGQVVWIILAGEITKMKVKSRSSVKDKNGNTMILYNIAEISDNSSEWVWFEEHLFLTKEKLLEAINREEKTFK